MNNEKDQHKTKAELLSELTQLRREVARLKAIADDCGEQKQLPQASQSEESQKRTAELEEASNFLNSIIENIPIMVVVKDAQELRFVRWNKYAEQLVGITQEEIIGKSDYDFFPKEEADFFTTKDREVLTNRKWIDIPEEPIQTASGETRLLHTQKVPVYGADGQPKYLVAIAEDITERKQREEIILKRARDLEIVARVGTATSTILEIDKLLQEVVDLTKSSFNVYHAHVYLLNQAGDTLILAAGAGEVGRQMVQKSWSIPLEREHSLVARAARSRQGVVVNDVRQEPDFFPNPLLPHTRAEMAIPLIVGNQLLGVLDVQADTAGRFTEEDVRLQTILAGQVAVALQNARSFSEQQRTQLMLSKRINELDCLNDIGREIAETPPIPELLQWVTERIPPAMQYGELCMAAIEYDNQIYGKPEAVALPCQIVHALRIGGEVVGRVYIAYTEKREFLDEESALIGGIANRLGGYIESRRLVEQAQVGLAENQRQKEFLGKIINILPVGLFAKDMKDGFRFSIWNTRMEEMFGVKAEEILGKTDYDYSNKEDADNYRQADLAAIEAGQIIDIPVEKITTVYGPRLAHTTKLPIFDSEGKPETLLAVLEDITERKQVEETLRENQARLSEALSIARLANWELDLVTQTFTFNDQFYSLLRTTAEQEGGYLMPTMKYAQKFVHPDDTYVIGVEIKKAIESTDPNFRGEVEHRIIRADGSEGYILVRAKPIRDEQGRVVKIIGANQDITERKQIDEALAKRATQLQTVAQVSTATSTILEADKLLQEVVDLTKKSFNLYHAHIYLLNEAEDTLILAVGAGEVGRQMVEQGWSIPLNREQSLVASAARSRRGVVVNDVRQVPDFLPNPLLLETRSEMAVPLVVGDTLLGVLDVQSDVVNHFTEDDIQIQTTLATQIAIAVQNARSFEQTRTTLIENQQQRRTLQAILDNMPVGVFVIDARTTRPQLVNRAGNALLGYEVDLTQPMQVYRQLYKLGTNTLVPPEERVVAKVMAGAELAQAEEDLVQPNGSRITINVTAVPIRNEQEEIISVLVLFQDITERKQAEEALRASQESLAEALRTAKLANWEFDVATQIFTFNDQFYALLHTTAEQEGGYQMPAMQYAQKFVHPDEAYLVGVEIQKALETTDPNFRGELEHRIIRADGSEGYIVVRFRVVKDEQGRTIKTIGANQDISERKQIDEALRASEARQRALLNAIPDLIMRLSGDGVYLDVKPARDFPTMVPPEQLIGKNSFELLPPELAQQRQNYIEQALKTGEIQVYEHQLERSDRTAYEEVRVIPSGENEVLMTIRDISDRKQAELERERLLAEVEAAYRQYVRREWNQFLGERQGNWRIEHQVRPVEVAAERLDQLQNEVMVEGKTKVIAGAKDNGQTTDPIIVTPIALRGQVIGALSLQDIDPNRAWTEEEKALVETVSEQLALTVENLRLFDDTQKQATREQLARQITDKLRAAPDVDSIIETGLAELGKALGVSRTYLKLTTKLEDVEPPH